MPHTIKDLDVIMKQSVDRSAGTNSCWPWIRGTSSGYGRFHLNGQMVYAHRAAYFLTRGTWPECVLHHCDNRRCCNPRHLFSGDRPTTMADCLRKGRQSKGSARWNAKLTEEQVMQIQVLAFLGAKTGELAKQFGVSPATISEIRHGKSWKHA